MTVYMSSKTLINSETKQVTVNDWVSEWFIQLILSKNADLFRKKEVTIFMSKSLNNSLNQFQKHWLIQKWNNCLYELVIEKFPQLIHVGTKTPLLCIPPLFGVCSTPFEDPGLQLHLLVCCSETQVLHNYPKLFPN